jgi:hypothetical protein
MVATYKLLCPAPGCRGDLVVHYICGSKQDVARRLVATFDAEPQLLAYVRWATIGQTGGTPKFEQGSALAGYTGWEYSDDPLTEEDKERVTHNSTLSML